LSFSSITALHVALLMYLCTLRCSRSMRLVLDEKSCARPPTVSPAP